MLEMMYFLIKFIVVSIYINTSCRQKIIGIFFCVFIGPFDVSVLRFFGKPNLPTECGGFSYS